MNGILKWSICALTTAALLVMWTPARADDSAAKGKITGVVMKEGKAIAGVQVRLMKPPQRPQGAPAPQAAEPGDAPPPPPGEGGPGGPGGPGGNRPAPLATATTDADGRFVFDDIAAGDYGVNAGSREAGMGRARVHVEAGKTADVTIELRDRSQGGPGGPGGPGGGQRPQRPPQD